MRSMAITVNTSTRGGGLRAAALLFLLFQGTPAFTAQSSPDVTVVEAKGVFTVKARFLVDEPPAIVMTVLTDYEHIPQFMPDIRTSIVRERAAGRALLEQEAVSGAILFSKHVHLTLEIEEQPDALVFHDRCGLSFGRYEGAWRLSALDGHTEVAYELTAEPSFEVPGFMLKHVLQRDSARMIERLQREIAARGVSAGVKLENPK